MILETIHSPTDVKALKKEQLPQLCQELREFLLYAAQLPHERVVFVVLDGGLVEVVVVVVVLVEFEAQALDICAYAGCIVHRGILCAVDVQI